MSKLQKFSLKELANLNLGINVLMLGYFAEGKNSAPENDDAIFSLWTVLGLQNDAITEITKRVPELVLDELDSNYYKSLQPEASNK